MSFYDVYKNNARREGIEYLEFDRYTNIFYDQCGMQIPNIYEYITPNDLFLYKKNKNSCYFIHRNNPNIVCKIFEGDLYDQELHHISCSRSGRGGCWFSSDQETDRESICRACSGGD